MKANHSNNRLAILIVFILGLSASCKKFVTIDTPVNQITAAGTFSNDATANSAIVGIYSRLSASNLIQATTPFAGMYADEIVNFTSGQQSEFSTSTLTLASSPTLNANFWTSAYQFIYPVNLAIEKLSETNGVTPAVKQKLLGEAKFIRAYLYLNLTGFFGDVPLVLNSSYEENATMPRTASSEVLKQIIEDLKYSISSLPENIDNEKIRANRWAAKALLARSYLYDAQYKLAAQTADEVIISGKFPLTQDLGKVFLKNSSEAILQLFPTQSNQNTPDGLTFMPATASETPKYYLTDALINAIEPGDLRKSNWIASRQFAGQTYFYPTKYKILNTAVISEYLMLLRIAEQYLIRAEANIQLGNITAGIADLNVIRARARAVPTPGITTPMPDLDLNMGRAAALSAVEKERRVELMLENGHRWNDLKRTGRAGAVLGTLKVQTWKPWAVLWPVPDEQLRLNPSLTQNDGYTK